MTKTLNMNKKSKMKTSTILQNLTKKYKINSNRKKESPQKNFYRSKTSSINYKVYNQLKN